MKILSIILLGVLFSITGCVGQNRQILPRENKEECERLRFFFESLLGYPWDKIKKIVFYGEDSNKPLGEQEFEDFKEKALFAAGCCSCRPHPSAKDWTEYARLDCVWEYLEKETVQKIGFCWTLNNREPPETWDCKSITEPERIKEALELLHNALEKRDYKFAHEGITGNRTDWMEIVTDKHKFAIPVGILRGEQRMEMCGIGWTSYELAEKMKQWFPQNEDPNKPK